MGRFATTLIIGVILHVGCQQDATLALPQSCEDCEIRTTVVWASVPGNQDVNLPTGVLMLDEGVLVSEFMTHRVVLFGWDGSTRRYIGRIGEGPGEYFGVSGLGLLPDGRVIVVARNRISVLDQALNFVHSFIPHVPPVERHFIVLDDSTIVLAGRQPVRATGPARQHVYTVDGRLRNSFDTATGGGHNYGPAADGRLWSWRTGVDVPTFRLQLWDPDSGEQIDELHREPPWFAEWKPTGEENLEKEGRRRPPGASFPLRPSVSAVHEGDDGLLWVATSVADPRYAEDPERKMWNRFRDSIVEVIDLGSGEVLAAVRYDSFATGFTNRGELVLYGEDESGVPRLEIRALELVRGRQ